MATNYPGALDNSTSLPNPTATNDTNSPSLSSGQTVQNGAVIAVETKVGTGSSNQTAVANSVLLGDGAGTSHWGPVTVSQVGSSTGTGAFVMASGATLTSPTINTATITNPTLKVDTILGNSVSTNGVAYGLTIHNGAITGTTASLSSVSTSGNISVGGQLTVPGGIWNGPQINVNTANGIHAGGSNVEGITFSNVSNFGIFTGSGVPTLSAAQGSLYLRSDGSSTSTRLYVNTNGSTGWTNVTTAT